MAEKPGKSIRQQIHDRAEQRLAEAATNPPDVENNQALSFVPPGADAPEGIEAGAEAPEAPEAAPLNAAPVGDADTPQASDTPSDAASAEVPKTADTSTPASGGEKVAAPQPVDDEYEDAEFEDTSTGHKYKFKAPKGEAEFLTKGWQRRADYDKKMGFLGRTRAFLEPLIESGYLEQVLPVYQAIESDQILAQAVGQLYQQRLNNQPLTYAQPGFEQRLPAVQAQNPQSPALPENDEFADPYMRAEFARVAQPLLEKIGSLEQQISSRFQAEQQQQQTYAQQQQANREENARWAQIHQQLARDYPQDFTGDFRNQAEMQRLNQLRQYADQSGYDERTYGWMGRILTAKRVLDQSAPRRVNAPSSAAVSSVAAAEAQAREASKAARQQVANGLVVGAQAAPPPEPPRPKALRNKNGDPLPIKQAIRRSIENAQLAR